MSILRIAICQSHIVFEQKNHNIMIAENVIEEAAMQQVDLILFPEMSFTGFSMKASKIADEDFETWNTMKQDATKHKISIGFGWVKSILSPDGRKEYENHYTIVSCEGDIILDYVKIHPFSNVGEDLVYKKGERLEFCEISNFTISTAICYDLRFPELFQLESKRADLIIVPANWPESRKEHWLTLLKARAIENQCYIIGINCTGYMNKLRYSGDSIVIHPSGRVIQRLNEGEEVFCIDLKNDVAETRKAFQVKQDRREEIYYQLFHTYCNFDVEEND